MRRMSSAGLRIFEFQLGERGRVQFRWEIFNMTNTPNQGNINFGQIGSTSSRRIIRLGLKLYW